MNNSAYKSFSNPDINQEFGTGVILAYQSDKKTYSVALDGKGVFTCRQLNTGIARVFKKDDRVVVLRCGTATWLVLGSYDPVPVTNSGDASYIQTDSLGEKEPQMYAGDVAIHNNKRPFRLRSLISVFSFGDILLRSTHACYLFLSKKTNSIKLQATNLLLSCRGFKAQSAVKEYAVRTEFVSFSDTRELSDAVKERHTVLGSLVEPINTGDKFTSPTATVGERTKFRRNVVYEVDNETSTIRFFQKIGITALIGWFTKENRGASLFSSRVTQGGKEVASGVCVKLGDTYTIVFDSDTKALSIASSDKAITLDTSKIELRVGTQVLSLDESGLTTSVTNHTTTVTGVSEEVVGAKSIQSTGDVVVRGTQIRLN